MSTRHSRDKNLRKGVGHLIRQAERQPGRIARRRNLLQPQGRRTGQAEHRLPPRQVFNPDLRMRDTLGKARTSALAQASLAAQRFAYVPILACP